MHTPPTMPPDLPRPPGLVRQQSRKLFKQAELIFGGRLAEKWIDPDRGIRITVVDLDVAETEAISDIARLLGIEEWVRAIRADPSDPVALWALLHRDLIELAKTPGILSFFPGPQASYQPAPIRIRMSAAAEQEAARLHAKYGSFVTLTVGSLPYPLPAQPTRDTPMLPFSPLADPDELTFELDGPAQVRSGQTGHHGLLVSNVGDHEITIRAGISGVSADILDPASDAVVAHLFGATNSARRYFPVPAGHTIRIPLTIGTASIVPELGYRIPAGQWLLSVPLELGTRHHEDRQITSPALPLTIID